MTIPALQSDYTLFVNNFQYKPMSINGGLYSISPQVLYNNVIYKYTAPATPVTPATNPVTYMNPDVDTSALELYTLGAGTSSEVLGVPLTGLVPASGTPTSTSTILQAMNNLVFSQTNLPANTLATPLTGLTPSSGTITAASTILQAFNALTYKTYAFIANIAASSPPVSTPLTLTGTGVSTNSTNITINATSLSLPLNKIFSVEFSCFASTGATSELQLEFVGANCTVTTSTIDIPSNQLGMVVVSGMVVTTSTASPTVSVQVLSSSGTRGFVDGALKLTEIR